MSIDYSQPTFWALVASVVVFALMIVAGFIWPSAFADNADGGKNLTEDDYLQMASVGWIIAFIGWCVAIVARACNYSIG